MKEKIRIGAFETNSSSEHTLALVRTDLFKAWKEGKYVAKVVSRLEDKTRVTGNFDSEMLELNFTSAAFDNNGRGSWQIQNERHLKELIAEKKKRLQVNMKKTIESLKNPEIAEIYNWTEDEVRENFGEAIKELDNSPEWLFEHCISKLYEGFWMTFEEFEHEMFGCDCISGFEHENYVLGITAIGKYNHT